MSDDMLVRQLECATDIDAVFCIACGQPDESDLHDPARCPGRGGLRDNVTIADALEVLDTSCEEEPDLDDHARALHCAIVARRPSEEHADFAGWLHEHKDYQAEFDAKLELTEGDMEAGWRQTPLYRQPGPTQDAYMRACRALHWHTAQLRAHGIEPDAIAPDAPHYPPEAHVFASQCQETRP